MAIRYKVVNEATRCSVIIGINSLYTLKYVKGTIVKALSGSLGIMVFKRRYQAEKFVKLLNSGLLGSSIILRVEIFERGKCPKYVSRWTTHKSDLTWFYSKWYADKKYITNGNGMDLLIPPKGTLCYSMVRVID